MEGGISSFLPIKLYQPAIAKVPLFRKKAKGFLLPKQEF